MDSAATGTDRVNQYALKPANPVRAWIVSALLLVLAILLIWGGVSPGETVRIVMLVLGVIAAVIGLVILASAVFLVKHRTVTVVFSQEGFEVIGPGYYRSGDWIDVDAVSATPDGSRLVIDQGHIERTFIQVPGGVADEQMKALTKDIKRRLKNAESSRFEM